MRVLWVKAPLLLRRYPPVLAAVLLTTALAALAASSVPLTRAGIESESLANQVRSLSPLAAGLEIRVFGVPVGRDEARRAAARRLGSSLRYLDAPVLSSLVPLQVAGSASPGLEVVALARTDAVRHVRHVATAGRPGAWIADTTATVTRVRPGQVLRLTVHGFAGQSRVVAVRVAGVYHALEADRDNPFWANWQQDIRSVDPDASPPPAFVLLDEATFRRVARRLHPVVENRFEFPVDTHGLSFVDARRLDRRFRALRAALVRRDSSAGRALECRPLNCRASSSLSAALTVAAGDVAAVSPTITLLSGTGLAIAFALAVASGIFLVRRRSDEANVLFVRGEATVVFGVRTALEATLPAAVGLAAGAGAALLALRVLAPAGAVSRDTVTAALWRALAAVAVSVACVALGAASAFPRRTHAARRSRRLPWPPWELAPLVAAAVLLSLLVAGQGLARAPDGTAHPRLAVFLMPVLAACALAGLTVRALRRLLPRLGAPRPAAVFLAVRRVGAARGLLTAVVVAAASAFGVFAYTAVLAASLDRSVAEKAFVANGSDVQGFVDPAERITSRLPFPATIVQVDQVNVSLATGERVDLVAGDSRELADTLRWNSRFGDDPRRLLPRLRAPSPGGLPAIASPGAPAADAIVDQGVRIPLQVVGHAPVPGSTAGRPALLVSWPALRRIARRARILDPAPGATGLLWAKGDPARIESALEASNLAPAYLTTLADVRSNASVAAVARSYRYVKLIGLAAAALSLVALVLYLQARQRSQRIATALVRRMGLGPLGDAIALGLEASMIVALAGVVGAAVALTTVRPIVHHVDSLAQYAPSPVVAVPWAVLGATFAAACALAALFGAAAAWIAARSDVAEALRVA